MTYSPKHMSPVRRRSALVPGPAAQERPGGAHAGSRVVPQAPVLFGRGSVEPIPALPRGWATGLLIAVWFAGFVGLVLLCGATRPADDTDQAVERDRPAVSAAAGRYALGVLVQSVAIPSSTPQLPARHPVAQVAQPSPVHADGRAHPAKSSSAISTPGA